MTTDLSPRVRSLLAALLALALLLTACGDDDGDGAAGTGSSTTEATGPAAGAVSVMSRNLYLGTDLVPLFEATGDTLAAVAAETYQAVVDSDPPARMAAVAAEIAATAPDVVGLQEATRWSEQGEGATEPTVRFDFVELLLAELEAAGTPYTVAASVDGFSGALPVGGVGLVTMQDRDVILVRDGAGVDVEDPRGGAYVATMEVEVAGITLPVQRGWVAVDLVAGGATVPFVNTHLEAFDDAVRDQQAAELTAIVDGFGEQALVVGDLNSAAGGEDPATYEAMLDAGFDDAWAEAGEGDGFSCCYDADVRGGEMTQRIDLVLARGDIEVESVVVVGTDDALSRTGDGIWASDHAGLVAELRLPTT